MKYVIQLTHYKNMKRTDGFKADMMVVSNVLGTDTGHLKYARLFESKELAEAFLEKHSDAGWGIPSTSSVVIPVDKARLVGSYKLKKFINGKLVEEVEFESETFNDKLEILRCGMSHINQHIELIPRWKGYISERSHGRWFPWDEKFFIQFDCEEDGETYVVCSK